MNFNMKILCIVTRLAIHKPASFVLSCGSMLTEQILSSLPGGEILAREGQVRLPGLEVPAQTKRRRASAMDQGWQGTHQETGTHNAGKRPDYPVICSSGHYAFLELVLMSLQPFDIL